MFSELTQDDLVERHHVAEDRLMDMVWDEGLFRKAEQRETELREERIRRALARGEC